MHNELASGTPKPWNEIVAALTAEAWLNPNFARSLAEDKAAAIKGFAAENGISLPDNEDLNSFHLAESPIGDVSTPPHFNQWMTPYTQPPSIYCPSPACPSVYGCSTASGCLSSSGCFTSGCPTSQAGCTSDCPTAYACTQIGCES
jgi:hypothetical protein